MDMFRVSNPVLHHFAQLYPDVFCAGGYVVDHLLGVEPKDIDLFTFIPLRTDEGVEIHGMTQEELDTYDLGGNANLGRIRGVRRFTDFQINTWTCPIPIEIIQLHTASYSNEQYRVSDSVSKFSFGIQQAWLSPDNGHVQITPAFWSDYTKKQFTVTNCRTVADAERLGKKLKRLKQKYGNWPLMCNDTWFESITRACNNA